MPIAVQAIEMIEGIEIAPALLKAEAGRGLRFGNGVLPASTRATAA